MFPKTKDVINLLEKCAPSQLAESWDNPGLQVGSLSQEIKKIFMALDPTPGVLRNAVERRAQLLLTHHPLIFKPCAYIDINAFPGNVVAEAVRNHVSLVAAHTNLDRAQGGINDILAELFGLRDVEVLEDMPGGPHVGLGRVGNLARPIMLSALIGQVKEKIGIDNIKLTTCEDMEIRRIAIVGGSGSEMAAAAVKKGADILITGDIRHHQALAAHSLGLILMDAGHYNSEKAAFNIFAEYFKKMAHDQGWRVSVEIDNKEKDPFTDGSKI